MWLLNGQQMLHRPTSRMEERSNLAGAILTTWNRAPLRVLSMNLQWLDNPVCLGVSTDVCGLLGFKIWRCRALGL